MRGRIALSQTHHPSNSWLRFAVTCPTGGWCRRARAAEFSIDIPVGAMRAYEFVLRPGDWAIHSTVAPTMNAMGHGTKLSREQKDIARPIRSWCPTHAMLRGWQMGE